MKTKHILFFLSTLMFVSGCDFFRKVAGRETSSDIQEKKILIEQYEEKKLAWDLEQERIQSEQARLDSIAEMERQIILAEEVARQDSLVALDVLNQQNCMMYDLQSLRGLASGELSHRYYIMLGSFKTEANADKLISQVEKNSTSLQPVKICFRNTMIGVGVCPRNKVVEIVDVLDDVKSHSFCPKDAWILVNCQ